MSFDPMDNRIILEREDEVVARAVLLILQTVVGREGHTTADSWRFYPEERILSDQEATERLSRMAKPLACEVACSDSTIELRCGHPDEDSRWKWWAQVDQSIPTFGSREQAEIDRTGNTRVLLVGEAESIVLSVSQIEQLARDYVIIGKYTVSSFVASRLDPSLDVAVVWRYWASTSTTVATVVDG
jgi:hypothetical protein